MQARDGGIAFEKAGGSIVGVLLNRKTKSGGGSSTYTAPAVSTSAHQSREKESEKSEASAIESAQRWPSPETKKRSPKRVP